METFFGDRKDERLRGSRETATTTRAKNAESGGAFLDKYWIRKG